MAGPNSASKNGASYENNCVSVRVAPNSEKRLSVLAPARPMHSVSKLSM